MTETLQTLFVIVAHHSGQLAPLLAFALVTVATLLHAAAGRRRQTLAGIIAGAAFVVMYAMFTVLESRDIRSLFDNPWRDAVMAAMFGLYAVLEGVGAIALIVGRHGLVRVPPAEPPPQD